MGLTISDIRRNTTHARHLMQRTRAQHFAVGAFNIDNQETLIAVARAAQKLQSPVLVEVSDAEVKAMGLENVRDLVDNYKAEYGIEMYLNLDHGPTVEGCKRAIDAGYEFVHIDISQANHDASDEEIIAKTREVVEYAKFTGALVESEPHYFWGSSNVHTEAIDYEEIKKTFSTPEGARDFVEATGIDTFAAAVGNLHGLYPVPKVLDLELLARIRETLHCQISLHGGSGTPLHYFEDAAKIGVSKININSDMRYAFRTTLEKTLRENPNEYAIVKLMPPVYAAVQEVVETKIQAFGLAGKGSGVVAKIITVGAGVQDVFLSQSDALKPVCESPEHCFARLDLGAKADVNQIHFATGGGATNAAVTFARQGHQALFMGIIGKDPAGQAVLDDLDKEGVGTQLVKYSLKYSTGYSVLLLAPNGERTILTYRGASTHYHPADFDISEQKADWLYVSTLSGNMDVLNKLFRQARDQGIKICFNPGKKELAQKDKLIGLLQDVEILTVNREEMQLLVSGDDLESLARNALNLVPVVLITDGVNGSIASDGRTIVRAGMYDDRPSIDRTGAGDAFASGFLSAWAEDSNLKNAIIFASANASSVVMNIGAKTGILQKGTPLHAMPIHEKEV